MTVLVRMGLRHRAIMGMLVMFIMGMAMVVVERFVLVRVLMALRKVQP